MHLPKCSFKIKNWIIILYSFCTILYTKSQILYTLPSCAFGSSNWEGGLVRLGVQNCKNWVQNYDPVFYVEAAFGVMHVSHTPLQNLNCQYRKKEGCTKLGTWCTKWVHNYDPVFYLETAFGGCMSPAPQIWIADSARRNGVQNLRLDVQNCTKWVQNYDPVFYVETAFGGAACHQPPKFELLIAQEGMVYKIWDLVYKIVQNKYRIMIHFSFSKSVLGGRWLHLLSSSLGRGWR